MKRDSLPNVESAVIARGKLVDYLLSEAHPDGHGKARFFSSHGFSASEWEVLAAALRAHATTHGVVESAATAFGVRYIVEGELEVPDGRRPLVRVVWFIRTGRDAPELVTAYPMKRRS